MTKLKEKDFASAAFYYGRLTDVVRKGASRIRKIRVNQTSIYEKTLEIAYLHANVLLEARQYKEAHEMIADAIEGMDDFYFMAVSSSLRQKMYTLRGHLDELHASLQKLKNAKYWYGRALECGPGDESMKEATKRLERKIYIADSSNW